MSNELQPYQGAIKQAKDRFQKVAASSVNYDKESIFAMQALMKTSFAMDTANKNPQSVHLAMINVASTGLTLNPANGYAYLVPRDGQIVLDISYKGLIKIATDSGAVVWARADIVYADDQFTYHGPASLPEHTADPFKVDRGAIVGCYCIAKTKDGDILTEVMPMAELEKIRGKSMAYAKKHSGPWVEWFEQMAKKAVIKRASKTWPYTDDRLAQAVEVANNGEGGYDLDGDASGSNAAIRIEDTRKARHDDAADQYGVSVQFIKDKIALWDETQDEDCLYSVAEAWAEIPSAAQIDLWLAPTKGGIFTTHERDTIKTKLPRSQAA
jgi:recombination protein RecT